jgi:hypothetical protein
MKTKYHLVLVILVAVLSAVFAASAAAQGITPRTTAGTYVVACDGYLTFPSPFPPNSNPPTFQFAPAKALGTATADEHGHFTGETVLSVGGFAVVTQTVSGTENLNRDGTGTITYSTTVNGQPGPPLNISFVVSEHGDRIDGLSTDAGTVFACVLRRISREDDRAGLLKPVPSPQHVPTRQAESVNTATSTPSKAEHKRRTTPPLTSAVTWPRN